MGAGIPQGNIVFFTMLIECHGMIGMLYDAAQLHVVEAIASIVQDFESFQGNAECPYRIPDP
jgi:hypothetical protein